MSRQRDYELIYDGKATEAEILSTSPLPLRRAKALRGAPAWRNILIEGENLGALASLLEMKRAGRLLCADGAPGARLVYIDPPFSTRSEFRGSRKQRAYDDRATGAEFVESLRRRLVLLRELLADNGSIFVHLDWKKAHYMKVVMDELFGEDNFLNDIVWSYGGRGAKAVSGQFSRNHDILLWYRKGGSHVFNQRSVGRRVPKKGAGFRQDELGRWFKTSPRGDYTDESVAALESQGRVYRTRSGSVRIKYFLREEGGSLVEDRLIGDVWDDIPDAMHLPAAEKTGYPTQKPEALLARVILASSMPGDLVLDCYAGAGTTLVAAEKLGRRWAGVDSGRLSVHTIEKRLLTIRGSKRLEGPAGPHKGECAPFDLLAPAAAPAQEMAVGEPACECLVDSQAGQLVIRASWPQGHGGCALSTVALDLDHDGQTFHLDSYHAVGRHEKDGPLEVRVALDRAGHRVALALTDIHGNERRLEAQAGQITNF